MTGASFADLKQKRTASATGSAGVGRGSPSRKADTSTPAAALYDSLDGAAFEIRDTEQAGRSLYAKKTFEPGSILLRVKPHLRLLDNAHTSILCSRCMLETPNSKRCSACKAVYYCSMECQRADWKPDAHKLDCQKLQDWAKLSKAAGRPVSEHLPSTPIRAMGRLILLKSFRNTDWWQQIVHMAQSPVSHDAEAREHLGSLALAVTQYLVGPAAVNALFPGMDAQQITKTLLALVDQFGINSFSLTTPDLTNVGVAICPLIALINHSCDPNCTVVFPEGAGGDMHVVAFKQIQAGEEILSSYVDITMPRAHRQVELYKQYKFNCTCSACEEKDTSVDTRHALQCSKTGCLAALPFPDMNNTAPVCELVCPVCGTLKRVSLAQSEKKNLGLRWALQEAEFQLSVKDPEAFHAPPQARQAAFEVLLHQLSEIHGMHSASYPLLALHRVAMDRALSEQRYGRARGYARRVMQGLDAIFSPGHPVRAIHQVVLGRLMSISDDGGEIQDDLALIVAYEQLKKARAEVQLAFGANAIMLKELRQSIVELERDLDMRKKLRAP